MSATTESSFELNVTLTRCDVVAWLSGISSERLREEVENKLAAGLLVLSLIQASTGEDAMQRFFRPVVDRMDGLKQTLDTMLRATQRSKPLGDLGEDLVLAQLQRAFPGDKFEIVGQKPLQADIRAGFLIDNEKTLTALIEVKFWSDTVPTSEAEKFRQDLKAQGIRHGLMVSLTSGIAGIAGPLRVENNTNHVVTYVPNAGLDGCGVLWGAAVLKSIMFYEARADAARPIPTGAIETAWSRLNAEMKELNGVAKDVCEFCGAVRSAQQSLNSALDSVVQGAIRAEQRLRLALERITMRLNEELSALLRYNF